MAAQVNGRDFVLIDLRRCRVFLMGHLPALRLLGLQDCAVAAGPVTGAVFVDSAERCTLSLATYQVGLSSAGLAVPLIRKQNVLTLTSMAAF